MATLPPWGLCLDTRGSSVICRPHLLGGGFPNEVHLYLLQLPYFLTIMGLQVDRPVVLTLNIQHNHRHCDLWEKDKSWLSL